jgi:hypothetical protein
MGDHFSSPRVFGDPAADIADVFVFPRPEGPGRVVLVMTVFPSATVASLFSDALTYRFRIRPVTVPVPGAGYVVGEDEYTFDFTFDGDGAGGLAQAGRCVTPGGQEVVFRVGDEMAADSLGLRIYAGARLDPFFIALTGVRETRQLGRLMFKPTDTNANEGQNVLAIVIEVDLAAMLGAGAGPLLAVVGETVTSGGHPVRLEHTARAELKNFLMWHRAGNLPAARVWLGASRDRVPAYAPVGLLAEIDAADFRRLAASLTAR